MTYNQLIEKIASGKVPDLGDVLGNAFELFKKAWLQGFLYVILSVVLVLPAIFIMYIPMVGVAVSESQGMDPFEQFGEMAWLPLLPFFLLFFIVILLAQAIVMALQAGLYRSFEILERGEEVKPGVLFMFLKGRYIGKTFVLALYAIGIALLATALCVLPVIYVSVPIYFFGVIFAFNPELRAIEVVRAAFKLGNKTWFVSFVLIILSSLLAQFVGVLACGIGLLFTAAFVYMTIYHIYKDTTEEGYADGVPEVIQE
ncbi:hypothetical protein [Robertkochia flava]|uniref:hypothetical protein n=1 Tax=Robertkochia flava TaxID=3447986 RepID=UPI001CCE4273|nr:hypothetical protein [Robertkochia marina]